MSPEEHLIAPLEKPQREAQLSDVRLEEPSEEDQSTPQQRELSRLASVVAEKQAVLVQQALLHPPVPGVASYTREVPERTANLPRQDGIPLPRRERPASKHLRTLSFRKNRIWKGSPEERIALKLTESATDYSHKEVVQDSPTYKKEVSKLTARGYKYVYSTDGSSIFNTSDQKRPSEDHFTKLEHRELEDHELRNITKLTKLVPDAERKLDVLDRFGLTETALKSLSRYHNSSTNGAIQGLAGLLNSEEDLSALERCSALGVTHKHIQALDHTLHASSYDVGAVTAMLRERIGQVLPVLEANSGSIERVRELTGTDPDQFKTLVAYMQFLQEGGNLQEVATVTEYIRSHPVRGYSGKLEASVYDYSLAKTALDATKNLKSRGVLEGFLTTTHLPISVNMEKVARYNPTAKDSFYNEEMDELTSLLETQQVSRYGTPQEVGEALLQYAALTENRFMSLHDALTLLTFREKDPLIIYSLAGCLELEKEGLLDGVSLYSALSLSPYVTNPAWVATYKRLYPFVDSKLSTYTAQGELTQIEQLSAEPETLDSITSEPFCHFLQRGYRERYVNSDEVSYLIRYCPHAREVAQAITQRSTKSTDSLREMNDYASASSRHPTTFSDPAFSVALAARPHFASAAEGIAAYFAAHGESEETKQHCLTVLAQHEAYTANTILKLQETSSGLAYTNLVEQYLQEHGKEHEGTFYSSYGTVFAPHVKSEADLNRMLSVHSRNFGWSFVSTNPEALLTMPEQKIATYFEVCERIQKTCCQELIRVQRDLLPIVLAAPDPLEAYEKIEKVFLRNNLPYVGKAYSVFNILYPPQMLASQLKANGSPALNAASTRERYSILYNDLIKVQVASGNRSLESYVSLLSEYEATLATAEAKQFENLTEEETAKLNNFAEMLSVLTDNSSYKRLFRNDTSETSQQPTFQETLQQLRRDIGVKEGQSITERLHEMFLSASGTRSFGELTQVMQNGRVEADAKNREYASSHPFLQTLRPGTLVKGVQGAYLSSILQNGSVAKEFLGGGSTSDMTPLDTDLEMIQPGSPTADSNVLAPSSMAQSYGDLILFMAQPPEGYELFETGYLGNGHMGIRTGFPLTAIDGFVCSNDEAIRKVMDYKVAITENGYYIPIYSRAGELLFSPEEFDSLRNAYRGLARFNAPPISPGEESLIATTETAAAFSQDQQTVRETFSSIKNTIETILAKHGISLRKQNDHSFTGAELENTGSTGRGTNKPGDYDFDLSLRLDPIDFDRLTSANVAEELREAFQPKSELNSTPGDLTTQYRFFGATVGSTTADIDIAVTKKSELQLFATHQAIQERLASIPDAITRSRVAADIIWIKNELAKKSIYKKGDHAADENQVGGQGGLGGVGVETWVLNHNGSVKDAVSSFAASAFAADGSLVPLETFKQTYPIVDPGINLRHRNHDNYVYLLRQHSYEEMAMLCQSLAKEFSS